MPIAAGSRRRPLGAQAGVVTDLDRRNSQIDSAIEKATAKGRTATAMALADQQRKTPAASPRTVQQPSSFGGRVSRWPN